MMFSKDSILSYHCENEGLKTIQGNIQRLFKDKGREFILLSNGQKINLDQVNSINGIAF